METNKHRIIADMIAFAKADDLIHDREREFILTIANRMGINEQEVSEIFEQPHQPAVLTTELERVTHFHRLLVLMYVDEDIDQAEVDALRNYGLRLGIRAEAITQILNEMHDYEDKLIPSERMITIFKRFYN